MRLLLSSPTSNIFHGFGLRPFAPTLVFCFVFFLVLLFFISICFPSERQPRLQPQHRSGALGLRGMKSSPAASPPRRPEELVNICAPLSDRWATPAERKLPKEQTGLKCISSPIWRKKVHLPRGSSVLNSSSSLLISPPLPRLLLPSPSPSTLSSFFSYFFPSFFYFLPFSSSSLLSSTCSSLRLSQQMFVEVVLASTSTPGCSHHLSPVMM